MAQEAATTEVETMGQNIRYYFEDDKTLVIKVDVSKTFGRSSSGKTTVIASSKGNQAVQTPGGQEVKLGLNCYKY